MNAPDVAYQVARQFTALRRRYLSVRIASAFFLAAAFALASWTLLAIVDYRWELTRQTRIYVIAGAMTLATCGFVWRLFYLIRNTRRRPFAAIVERSFDDFGQRIRTVLDTVDGRVQGPLEMLTALGNQTLGRWESVSPARIIPMRKLWGSAVVFVAFIAALLAMAGLGGDWRKALYRSVGGDQLYTMLEVSPGDVRLLEGTNVNVSLDLIGRTERDVLLRYRELRPAPLSPDESPTTESGDAPNELVEQETQWIESELVGEAGDSQSELPRKTFLTSLGKATWPIEYQFVSSGQQTAVHRIDIQPLIEIERIEIRVQPPEYTGLQARLFSKPDLTVLERSEVMVTIVLNHALADASLELGPKMSKLVPVEMEAGSDRSKWTFSLPAEQTLRWRFSGAGSDGTPMEPVKGRLGIRRDAAPSIRWREPSDEIKVHTLAEVPLAAQVSDDHGIIEAGIAFQLGGNEEYILTDWMPESDPTLSETERVEKTRLMLAALLPLESFELSERDYIGYYAYAVDNRPWGNHRSESDVRYIDIRPLRQFYQEVDPPGGNNGGGSRVLIRLDEIIRRERFVINRTRKLVRGGVDMATQLGTIDRLVKNQSELADLTRFLTEFFIQRGNDDVEALSQAEATMLQAADSLAAGSLDLSLAQEQDALRSLAEARRTLEIALSKRMTRAQQQALRRLARQLRQKLRRDRPETERELADSLKRIAAQQSRVASMSRSIASNMKSDSDSQVDSPNSGSNGQGKPQDPDPEKPSDDESSDETDPPSENADSDPSDASQDSDDDERVAAEDSDETDQAEALYEQQIDLLERLEAVRDQLGERLADSDLMTRRMDDAQEGMDAVADQVRQGEFETVAQKAQSISQQINEMSLQLEALSAMEPVTRVSSLRDLTGGLSGMEHQLSKSIGSSDFEERQNDKKTGVGESRDELIDRLAKRMTARSETIDEVIRSQADIGDIEMSEVNDQLQRFAEENEFLDKLAATQSASQEIRDSDSDTNESASTEALERAIEYAEAARELERLYQQLVTPRLARLRKMEQRANQLANRMKNGGGSGGKDKKKDAETESELRQLKKELEEESLRELAEMLAGGQDEDSDSESESESGTGDEEMELADDLDGNGGLFPQTPESMAGRVRLVADELRKRIQQVILLEIAVDRDTPIPSKYRRAVDGYFKTLAAEGDSESAEMALEESR